MSNELFNLIKAGCIIAWIYISFLFMRKMDFKIRSIELFLAMEFGDHMENHIRKLRESREKEEQKSEG